MSIDHFSSAGQMLDALRRKDISSVELTELHIDRINDKDGELNAIPVKTFDRARQAAIDADTRIAKGETGALLGLPMTLKESTLVAGLPQSAGIPMFAEHTPQIDGPIASSVFDAGAGLLGKTNIPVALADWQADSPVYGRTNNPWDLTRTPGGSTGGGGAALAAGLTPLEIGSDIGGSIRIPAAFCGCFGHRPSETAIPKTGAFPLADIPNPAFYMGVQGPLARTAADLSILFDVVSGPESGEDRAWRLDLPVPRHKKLSDFRVSIMHSAMDITCSSQVSKKIDELEKILKSEGTTLESSMPEIDLPSYFADYVQLLNSLTSQGTPRAERESIAAELRKSDMPFADAHAAGYIMDAHDYRMLVARRQWAQMLWQQYFADVDVIIAPITLDSAFPHQTLPMEQRTVTIDNVERSYFENIFFAMLAIFTGLPSTTIPAGLDDKGLPIGLQIIGPYLEDRTTLQLAELIEQQWCKFQAPPNYS